LPVWYIMDEVGLAMTHDSEDPNFACVPFLHFSQNVDDETVVTSYSLAWPLKNVAAEEMVKRNFTLENSGANQKAQTGLWVELDSSEFTDAYRALSCRMNETTKSQGQVLGNHNFSSVSKIEPVKAG
jgi:hypothetical protein